MAQDSPLNIYDNSTSRNQRTTALFARSLYRDLNINDAAIFASQSFRLTEALLHVLLVAVQFKITLSIKISTLKVITFVMCNVQSHRIDCKILLIKLLFKKLNNIHLF